MISLLANKFSNSISDDCLGHPCTAKLLYSSRNRWIMVFLIRASSITDLVSNILIIIIKVINETI